MWADHDIFALPTWYEPYGLVFLEARAAGVPSLGRDAYCMPELVPPSAGRLIPPTGGVEAVAEELLAISQDHDLFAVRRGRQRRRASRTAHGTASPNAWSAGSEPQLHRERVAA